jgi:NTE family protein
MPESIGLVLAGGGARGAYEIGALRTLLPWLEREGRRPDVIVGTSVGALNAAYLAANAGDDSETLAKAAWNEWLDISYEDVLEPFLSLPELATAWRVPLGVVLRRVLPYSLLQPAPLAEKLRKLVAFEHIHENVEKDDVALRVCAVVATAAHTNRSVVFHDGGPEPASDERRGIDYVATRITSEHVRASAAIPVAFPAVQVDKPPSHAGWYFDGGTRLNTPIKPALELGAERVVVIGLNSLASAPASAERGDLFDGASQLVQGLLVDPLMNDVETLATINETVQAGGGDATGGGNRRVVPYIFVAPQRANTIGAIAKEVYEKSYNGLRGVLASRDLYLLGRLVGADRNTTRGELFSYLFFAREFARRLLELGRRDAQAWIDSSHDADGWQIRPLPLRDDPRGAYVIH